MTSRAIRYIETLLLELQRILLTNVFIVRVVELCLAAAAKRDPSNLALHFYKNGENPDDSAGMAAFHARSSCYSQVLYIFPSLGTFCKII